MQQDNCAHCQRLWKGPRGAGPEQVPGVRPHREGGAPGPLTLWDQESGPELRTTPGAPACPFRTQRCPRSPLPERRVQEPLPGCGRVVGRAGLSAHTPCHQFLGRPRAGVFRWAGRQEGAPSHERTRETAQDLGLARMAGGHLSSQRQVEQGEMPA